MRKQIISISIFLLLLCSMVIAAPMPTTTMNMSSVVFGINNQVTGWRNFVAGRNISVAVNDGTYFGNNYVGSKYGFMVGYSGKTLIYADPLSKRVGIGSDKTPTSTLDVYGSINTSHPDGRINTQSLCIKGDCINAWPVNTCDAKIADLYSIITSMNNTINEFKNGKGI